MRRKSNLGGERRAGMEQLGEALPRVEAPDEEDVERSSAYRAMGGRRGEREVDPVRHDRDGSGDREHVVLRRLGDGDHVRETVEVGGGKDCAEDPGRGRELETEVERADHWLARGPIASIGRLGESG